MPSTFNVFKTWSAGDILTASDLNSSFTQFTNNLDPSGLGPTGTTLTAWRNTSNPYPNNVEALPASFLIEMQQIKYVLLGLNGGQYWYQSAGYMSAGLVAASSLYDNVSQYRKIATTPTALSVPLYNSAGYLTDKNQNQLYGMTGETSSKSATSPITLNLGSVTAGDRIWISGSANVSLPNAAATSYAHVFISKSSGTASGVFGNDHTAISITGTSASGVSLVPVLSVGDVFQVTVTGTLVMQLTVSKDAGTTLTDCEIYAFFLKKQ